MSLLCISKAKWEKLHIGCRYFCCFFFFLRYQNISKIVLHTARQIVQRRFQVKPGELVLIFFWYFPKPTIRERTQQLASYVSLWKVCRIWAFVPSCLLSSFRNRLSETILGPTTSCNLLLILLYYLFLLHTHLSFTISWFNICPNCKKMYQKSFWKPKYIDSFLCDVWGEKWDSRQTAERQRWRVLEDSPVSTCLAGGKMSLLMDSSFLLHLQEPRSAMGIKYGIITVIILQLSIIFSLLLSLSL